MVSLGVLPLEVMYEIVEELCLHCTPPKREEIGEADQYRARRLRITSLASLCLTSRTLNSIAARHLYHRPDCREWWLLARTMSTRKDLARHVKHMNSLRWKYAYFQDEKPHRISGYYNKKPRLLEYADMTEADRIALLSAGTDASKDIMCSLCPNLEHLVVNDRCFREYFCRPRDSMMNLRHLEVRDVMDPEYGCEIADFASLFRAAPALTSLRFTEAGHCGDLQLTLSHVTRVDLDWCNVDAESFGNVLRLCPHLERLSYMATLDSCETGEQFTPRDAQENIIRHAHNLKSFHLDLSECEWVGREEEPDLEGEFDEAKRILTARGIDFTFRPT
jgi:hypothetical protein